MTRSRQLPRETPRRVFRDRREAGRILAGLLGAYRGRDNVVVLGLARGGVPVAWEVAAALGGKGGGRPDFAQGAVPSRGAIAAAREKALAFITH